MKQSFSILLSLLSIVAIAQGPDTSSVDRLLRQYQQQKMFSGIVLIKKNSQTIFEKAYGYSDSARLRLIQLSDRSNIGSIGKVFTSVLILQLAEQGKLQLSDHLSMYLPGLKFPGADSITLGHLLSHTSGLIGYFSPVFDEAVAQGKINSLSDIIPFVEADAMRSKKPLNSYQYSNSGFILLGRVLEKIMGKAYQELVLENIIRPLHLSATGPYAAWPPEKNLRGQRMDPLNQISFSTEPAPNIFFSDGGIYSTVEDLARFDSALRSGFFFSPGLLAKDSTDSRAYAPGLGLEVDSLEADYYLGHNGSTPFYKADYRHYLRSGYTIIFLANTSNVVSRRLADDIYRCLNGRPVAAQKKLLPNYLTDLLKEKKPGYLAHHYKTIFGPQAYALSSDGPLNEYGYALLTANRIDDAILIFTINSKLFPGTPNVFDSLGEAWLKKGDKKKAGFYYRKLLSLDPGNENARRMLDSMRQER